MIDFEDCRSMVVYPFEKLVEFHFFDTCEREITSSYMPVECLETLVEEARSLMGNRMVHNDYHLGNYVIEQNGSIYIFSISIKDCCIKVVLNNCKFL
ncbi:MAG: hypothetical protein IJS60_11355 [Abditibacteriota bacterium]|nr:hypothetical protein [Abditibacteriota bacterium]